MATIITQHARCVPVLTRDAIRDIRSAAEDDPDYPIMQADYWQAINASRCIFCDAGDQLDVYVSADCGVRLCRSCNRSYVVEE